MTAVFAVLRRYMLVLALPLLLITPAAMAADDDTPLTQAQLDQLVAPIALYPDSLLSQLLMATTYPDEFDKAYQWSKAHPDAKGDDAVKQVEAQNWDPSVASMVAFPEVLITLGGQPKWVKDMGDAFLTQTADVMDAVQRLRGQAQKAGNLKSNEQINVTTQPASGSNTQVIVVEPAKPDVVYVPTYNPTVVYGAWAYPTYPPYYYPPPAGYWFSTAVMTGVAWGVGIAVGNALWGGCNWGSHDVNINVNKYNNINTNRKIEGSGNRSSWKHDPGHRTSDYRGGSTERNRRQQDFNTNQREQFRGRDSAAAGTRDVNNRDTRNRDSRENSRRQAEQTMENRGISSPGHRTGNGQAERNRSSTSNQMARDNSNRARGDGATRDNALSGVNNRQAQHESVRGRESNQSQRMQGSSRPSGGSFNRGGSSGRSSVNRPARSGGRGR
ncbi:hypothetical protein HNQ50_002760 [Silvimonas terrae]|uniref:DUF3300 domain-containing protein n=1 Tax=Silvimonas terrae TaxID=300266 RepID=A0A840RIF1_9NEIS|nr:DUF3300 domain-containing protein [Silvimonas terrae]MBB5192023.1 hypothetical protein [Silvimonas terrae]